MVTTSSALTAPTRIAQLARSSIGAKAVMAVSGLLLVGFVFMHMLGNLQVFLGAEAMNRYAAFLKESAGELLWFARAGLLAAVVAHIVSAMRLVRLNRSARPVGYAYRDDVQVDFAARVMPMTGLIVLAFIIYHLAHFTIGTVDPELYGLHDAQGRHDVYSMVVLSFKNPWISGWYVFANLLLCSHLSHGLQSSFQSLGINNRIYTPTIRAIGPVLAAVLFIGFASVPVACLMGWVEPVGVAP